MSHLKTRFLACALALCVTPALAGTLASDGSSYLGVWHGNTGFQGFDLLSQPTGLTGSIDWAVYAPGTFPVGFLGYTPSPGEYVYAYQAFETGVAPLSSFAVNLEAHADNIGAFSGGGVSGQFPSASFLNDFDSANWLFDGIPQFGSSSGLVFSSPHGPMLSSGTTIDHGSSAGVMPVPSPNPPNAPEPATLTLALCGILGMAFEIVRRRRRARS